LNSLLRKKTPKSKAGRKHFDYVQMLKILVLQDMYNLSDERIGLVIVKAVQFCVPVYVCKVSVHFPHSFGSGVRVLCLFRVFLVLLPQILFPHAFFLPCGVHIPVVVLRAKPLLFLSSLSLIAPSGSIVSIPITASYPMPAIFEPKLNALPAPSRNDAKPDFSAAFAFALVFCTSTKLSVNLPSMPTAYTKFSATMRSAEATDDRSRKT